MLAYRRSRRKHKAKNHTPTTLLTSRKSVVLPQEGFVGRTVPLVQDFVHAGSPDAFAGHIEQGFGHGQKVTRLLVEAV